MSEPTQTPKPKPKQLTTKEKLFCLEYAASLNGAQSAIKAGYSVDSAKQIASENLSKPYLRAYIDQLLEERTINAKEVLARLSEQATFDIGDIADDEGNIDFAKAKANKLTRVIKSIKRRVTKEGVQWEYELYDAQAALVHLGRAYGAFTDKQEQSGEITIRIVRDNGQDANS